MGLSLSNMTGLALHWSIKKAKDEDCGENEDDNFSEDYSEDDLDEDNSNNEVSEDEEDEQEDEEVDEELEMLKRKNTFNMMNVNKKILKSETDSSMPGTSASKEASFTTDQPSTSKDANSTEEPTTLADSTDPDEFGKPKFHCEVRRWKQGNYTLVTDDNKELKTKALDLMVFFNCGNWSPECGGNVSYIARNEDDEVMTLFFF